MPRKYDALVVGSGTAGQTAAFALNRQAISVALVEHSDRPGGTCSLTGCQAKKWFYEGVETVARSRHLAGIGITTPAAASWRDLRDAKNRFTENVPSETVAGLKEAGIDFLEGRAVFRDAQTMDVNGRSISARFIILATGARPMELPMDGFKDVITSDAFMELDRLPREIIFIGGGFVSFEFAHFAVRLGPDQNRCTILESGPRVLGPFDEEMVDLLEDASAADGIDVRSNAAVSSVEKKGRRFKVSTEDGQAFEADLVVHGAGRAPNLDDLALDRAEVEHSKGGIAVNRTMLTSNSHVYAVGDCAATVQLARVADAEAHVAAADVLRRLERDDASGYRAMDYDVVPSVLFTYPQYAMVGATERELQEGNVAYRKSFGKQLSWPTYRRVGLKSAAFKLLSGEDGRLLGAHVISDSATGLIHACTLALMNRIPVADFYRQCILTPYPSRESDITRMLKPLIE